VGGRPVSLTLNNPAVGELIAKVSKSEVETLAPVSENPNPANPTWERALTADLCQIPR